LDELDDVSPDIPFSHTGIFLTHGHIGHYSGLMFLGRETMNANSTKVFAMPLMQQFLTSNGPWSQLVNLRNIEFVPLQDRVAVRLSEDLKVTPLLVPHRGEFTETCGFLIESKRRKVLFLPDIDKWELWEHPSPQPVANSEDVQTASSSHQPTKIEDIIHSADIAYLDATFFNAEELPNRNIKEIPHPFAEDSARRFSELLPVDASGDNNADRQKIRFIHLNHSNPLLNSESKEFDWIVNRMQFNVAKQMEIINM